MLTSSDVPISDYWIWKRTRPRFSDSTHHPIPEHRWEEAYKNVAEAMTRHKRYERLRDYLSEAWERRSEYWVQSPSSTPERFLWSEAHNLQRRADRKEKHEREQVFPRWVESQAYVRLVDRVVSDADTHFPELEEAVAIGQFLQDCESKVSREQWDQLPGDERDILLKGISVELQTRLVALVDGLLPKEWSRDFVKYINKCNEEDQTRLALECLAIRKNLPRKMLIRWARVTDEAFRQRLSRCNAKLKEWLALKQ